MEECTRKGRRRVTGKTVQDVNCEGDGGGSRVRRDSAYFLYGTVSVVQAPNLGDSERQ